MIPRVLLALLPLLPLAGGEYLRDTEPDDAARDAAEVDVTARWKDLLAAHPDYYAWQCSIDAMGCIFPQTYEAYGVRGDEGFVVDHASIRAEVVDVVVDPGYVDLRKVTVSVDGEEHDTGRWGCFVHFLYTCTYTWKAKKGEEVREYRGKPHRKETHHQLFPVADVAWVFGLEPFKDKKTLLIVGDLFKRPENE